MSTGGKICGRQAEASSTSAETSASQNSRASPVRTRGAETTSAGACAIPNTEGSSNPSNRLLARIKWNCQCNEHAIEQKVRALAREILNDWEAVIAFVAEPLLSPTNNDAERALRHAVIARRISFGTRPDEGSRFYAASLSVIDPCRKRGVDPWIYGRDLIAAARKGSSLPSIPAKAAT